MLSLSLFAVSASYIVFLIGFFVFSAFALYHLEEYGYVGDFSRTMIYGYILVAAVIMLVTVVAYFSVS